MSDCVFIVRPRTSRQALPLLFALRVLLACEAGGHLLQRGSAARFICTSDLRSLRLPTQLHHAYPGEYRTYREALWKRDLKHAEKIEFEIRAKLPGRGGAMAISVRVQRLHPDGKLPQYAHAGHAGDLCADLYCVEEKRLQPKEIVKVHTGIAIELPEGYGALVEQRSGLALKGIIPVGGVIDPGYRGEILVILADLRDIEVGVIRAIA